MDFDVAVKLQVYETIAETAKAPTSVEVAAALGSSVAEVEAAFQRLYQIWSPQSDQWTSAT